MKKSTRKVDKLLGSFHFVSINVTNGFNKMDNKNAIKNGYKKNNVYLMKKNEHKIKKSTMNNRNIFHNTVLFNVKTSFN